MKEHEVKLLLVSILFITGSILIAQTAKELALLIIIANMLAYILVVLCRVLDQLKKTKGETK